MAEASRKAYIITGPTSGIGRATALALASHGTVILVGRDRAKLALMQASIEQRGQRALSVICDLSDPHSVLAAAKEVVALNLPIAGLINNAGISTTQLAKNSQGWDLVFATNHLGPFLFTETFIPHLGDGTNILFVVSAVEDPERKPAKMLGMRGGRYISTEASARGEWKADGCKIPGADAYATSKQCNLATALAFARERPGLQINAVEPGITPGTGLGRGANVVLRFIFVQILGLLPAFAQFRSTPERAAQVITEIITSDSDTTGIYYSEKGEPMRGSDLVRETAFQDRVVTETRAFLEKSLSPSSRQ